MIPREACSGHLYIPMQYIGLIVALIDGPPFQNPLSDESGGKTDDDKYEGGD